MIAYQEALKNWKEIHGKVLELRGYLDIDTHLKKLKALDRQTTKEGFWDDQESAQKILKTAASHRRIIEKYDDLTKDSEDFEVYLELLDEDPDTGSDAEKAFNDLSHKLENLELYRMLSGSLDEKGCILTIKPGAGGTESQDWAQMLMRMYLRYLERYEYDFEIIELIPGEEAGIKSVAIEIDGDHPYGYLKAEIGVHRLVRISPFDSNSRRHTSFSAVFVYPKADDDIDIEINPADLRIDTYRASGAGGQHVNKTDSAIRITHLPTNVVVTCQNERSQHRNKDKAMQYLKAKLYQLKLDEEDVKKAKLEETKGENAWGNQIRSYVFQPYKMVKDMRTGVETSNVETVMDGDIHEFITEFLLGRKRVKAG
ncbi:peptide chain release factor 2 [Calditrichota bacterium]